MSLLLLMLGKQMQNRRKRRKEIKFQKRWELHKLRVKEADLVKVLTYPRSIFNTDYGAQEVKDWLKRLEELHTRMRQLKMNLNPIADDLVKNFVVKEITEC
jgi:hypothetical protein